MDRAHVREIPLPALMSSARSTSLLGLHYAVWDNDHAWLRELLEEEEPAADGNALSDRLEALDPQRCASSPRLPRSSAHADSILPPAAALSIVWPCG